MVCRVWFTAAYPQAQEQTTPLTTADKVRERADTIYVMCDGTGATLQAFLRLGRKHLFLYPVGAGHIHRRDILDSAYGSLA